MFIRHLRWKHAVHSLPTCYVFHNLDWNCYFFMRGLCVVYVWLGQTSVNENTTSLVCSNLCLTLDWRWSNVFLASTFTRRKTFTFLNMQKVYAEVDAHNKWITFIRRSRKIINDACPANHNKTHCPKFFIFCALDVRDGMCDWAFKSGDFPNLDVGIFFLLHTCLGNL